MSVAVPCCVKCDGSAEELEPTFKDGDRWFGSRRFLHQLGPADQPVIFEPCVPRVEIKKDTCKIVVTLSNHGADRTAFDAVSSHPRESVRRWLQARANIRVFDFCGSPSCRPSKDEVSIQIIVRVAAADALKSLRASGVDSVFVRPFFEGKEESEIHRVVPFPPDVDIAGAIRQASRIPDHCGVVKTHRGFGVRVFSGRYDEAVGLIRPEDAPSLLGQRFEVSGLPMSCGKEAITEVLSIWTGAVPVTTFRSGRSRTWIVAAPAPFTHTKLQHGTGLAYIQPARPGPRQSRAPAPRFVPSEIPREQPSWLKSWAGVAQSRLPSSPTSPTQPAARDSQMDTEEPGAILVPSQGATPKSGDASRSEENMILNALKAMELRLTSLATEVGSLQREVHRKDFVSSSQVEGERSSSRTASRQRGRVPVGKKLFA